MHDCRQISTAIACTAYGGYRSQRGISRQQQPNLAAVGPRRRAILQLQLLRHHKVASISDVQVRRQHGIRYAERKTSIGRCKPQRGMGLYRHGPEADESRQAVTPLTVELRRVASYPLVRRIQRILTCVGHEMHTLARQHVRKASPQGTKARNK